jgi:hypothetical protein
MPVYSSSAEAINAALARSIEGYPWLNLAQLDFDRVIIRESLVVSEKGLGIRYTTIYRDITGRYVGEADYFNSDIPQP